MLTSKRRTIGIFINRTGFHFENTVYRMGQEQAKKHNMNALFFATLGHRQSTNYYDELEKAVFAFAPVENLDGLLVTPDTYQMEGFHELLMEMLEKRVKCPVVCIRDHTAPYDRVFTDEDVAIRPIFRHLVEDHGYRRVHFLAGFPGHPDSERRLKCYYDEMEKHQLPLPENAVFHGSMWRSGGDRACDYFIREGQPLPQAIICANDYMAQSLTEELQKRGYKVPHDIAVTGFDNVEEQAGFPVRLTTVEQDYERMIAEAFDLLERRMERREQGLEDEAVVVRKLPAKMVLRESCGCKWTDEEADQRTKLLDSSQQMQNFRVRETSQMYFAIDMNATNTLEEMNGTIMRKRDDVPEMRDFYLCLFENEPGSGEKEGFAEELTEHVTLVSALRDHQDMGMPMERFSRSQLLPNWVWDSDEPQSLFIRLMHQRDHIYGYSAIRYEEGSIPSIFFHQWNVTISSALRHLFDQHKLQRLYEERRLTSIIDPLTGLYNRRGLEEMVAPLWEERCRNGENISVLTFDMDNLKPINDTFGHGAGDGALQTVAMALREVAGTSGIAARIGGDEFLLYLPGYDQAGAEKALECIEKTLDRLNRENNTGYCASMSGGACSIALRPGDTLDQCIRISDERMYEVKRQRKTARALRG